MSRALTLDAAPTAEAVESHLARLFRHESERWAQVEPSLRDVIDDLGEFVLLGGKRLRPTLLQLGFVGAGGEPATTAWCRPRQRWSCSTPSPCSTTT